MPVCCKNDTSTFDSNGTKYEEQHSASKTLHWQSTCKDAVYMGGKLKLILV